MENTMLNGKTVNVKIARRDLIDLMVAASTMEMNFSNENVHNSSMKWHRIHDDLKRQLKEFDEKHIEA